MAKKRLLFGVLLSMIFVCFAPHQAKAAVIKTGTCGAKGDNLTWQMEDDGTLTISGKGEMRDFDPYKDDLPWIVASDEDGEYDYDDRNDIAFEDLPIKHIVIKEGVTSIGKAAFYPCQKEVSIETLDDKPDSNPSIYESVSIPSTVTKIGDYAFALNKGMRSVSLPNSIKQIGEYAFAEDEGVKKISLPSGLESIGDFAFAWTSITDISFPSRLKSIGQSAFYDTKLLKVRIPSTIKYLDKDVFSCCEDLKEVTFEKGLLKEIPEDLFSYTALSSITIPENIVSIGDSAFYHCLNLKKVSLPKSLKIIGYSAFGLCKSLKNITLPAGVVCLDALFFDVSDGAFSGYSVRGYEEEIKNLTKLQSIYYQGSRRQLSEALNRGFVLRDLEPEMDPEAICKLDTAQENDNDVEKTLSKWSKEGIAVKFGINDTPAAESKNDTSAAKDVSYSDQNASSSVQNVTIGKLKYTINKKTGQAACTGGTSKKLSKVKIPAKVTYGGANYTVTSLGIGAFKKYRKLKSVSIGINIESIGGKAFYGCRKLKKIKILTEKLDSKTIGAKAFSRTAKKAKATVPRKKLKAYRKLLKHKGLSKKAKVKK